MPGDYQHIRYEVRNGVGYITLDRPPLNLIDRDLTMEYFDALDRADRDDVVKAIVLSGTGRGLSAGVDIRFIEQFDTQEMKAFVDLFYVEQVEKVRNLSKPIIAAVQGFAREGACTMAFSCDMVIAADDASFGYPGVPNLAAPPGMHVWHLQKLIGRMKAAELVFTGDPIDAVDAGRLGLVTKVVPRNELMAETTRLAERLAELSPLALRETRRFFYEVADLPFELVPRRAADAISSAFDTEDSKEARLAFNEKRKPIWKGR